MGAKMVPVDTRERIVNACERHKDVAEVAEMFGVSKRTVQRLVKQQKETGSVEPHVHNRGRKPNLTSEQIEQIRATLLETPDITLSDLIVKLELPISVSRLCRIVQKLGFRLKKKVIHASEQERPRRAEKARQLGQIH